LNFEKMDGEVVG